MTPAIASRTIVEQGRIQLAMSDISPKTILGVAAAGLGVAACCVVNSMRPKPPRFSELKTQLVTQGYCVVPAALSKGDIAELSGVAQELLDRPENQQFQEDKFTGSLIPLSKSARFAKLIAHKATLGALASLGFEPPRWLSGFIISKPPGGPSLGWHQVLVARAWSCSSFLI